MVAIRPRGPPLPGIRRRLLQILGRSTPAPLELVFTPNQALSCCSFYPVRKNPADLFEAKVREPGTQVLVYGLAQVGKTSLARTCLNEMGRPHRHLSCAGIASATGVLAQALADLGAEQLVETRVTDRGSSKQDVNFGVGATRAGGGACQERAEEKISHPWTEEPTVERIVKTMAEIGQDVILDDLELTGEESTPSKLGELAKRISDQGLRFKLILILAVEDEAEIPESLRACGRRIEVVKVPRLSRAEALQIIEKGTHLSLLALTEDVVESIIALSGGLPTFVHRLCLEAGRAVAVSRGRMGPVLTGAESPVDMRLFRTVALPRAYAQMKHVLPVRSDRSPDHRLRVVQRWAQVAESAGPSCR